MPNQGGVRLIKKKSSTNVPEGGGYYIFVIFNCFFCFLPKNVHCRMSDSPNLNCIFSGGGLWQKIKFLNAILIDLRVGGLGTFPYLNKFFKGFL